MKFRINLQQFILTFALNAGTLMRYTSAATSVSLSLSFSILPHF